MRIESCRVRLFARGNNRAACLAWVVVIAAGTGLALGAEPRRDTADQLFRRAPMADSTRSIVVPLATNLHWAFDAHLLRAHTVWAGPGLNLQGPPYTGQKAPFLCDFDGEVLWTNPPVCPWSVGPPGRDRLEIPAGWRFRGLSTKGGFAMFLYELVSDAGARVRVRESPRSETTNGLVAVVRRYEVAPCKEELFHLAHAVLNPEWRTNHAAWGMSVGTASNALTVLWRSEVPLEWRPEEPAVDYSLVRQVEDKLASAVVTNRVKGRQWRAWLRIPPHDQELSFEIVTVVSKGGLTPAQLDALPGLRVARPRTAPLAGADRDVRAEAPRVVGGDPAGPSRQDGDDYYRIEHFPVPREVELMVGGMDWLSNGDLAVCTWPGEVYLVERAQGPANEARYRRFARGLNEPLGLTVRDDRIYVVQKCELTRLSDTDGNGEADGYETVGDGWGFTGNYHAFAFGPVIDTAQNAYVFLAGQRGRWDVPFVGWCVRVRPDVGTLEGFCSGLRAPNGWAVFGADRDMFVTDNQGEWIGACKLNQLQQGKFYGFPSGVPAPESEYGRPKSFQPPAVWFPRRLAPSASGIAVIEDQRFGPFKGQMLVGDFQNSLVTRVALEKVNGQWQGAVWPFAKGFLSGVNRLAFGRDGKLYVGGLKNRAWPAFGPKEYSLDRVSFSGRVPFEVQEVHARQDGLSLVFTRAVDRGAAADVGNYDVTQFTYRYDSAYGSPEIDHDGRPERATTVQVAATHLSSDGLTVALRLEGWQAGYVTAVHVADVLSEDGAPLWHDTFYYTLNQIPGDASFRKPGRQ